MIILCSSHYNLRLFLYFSQPTFFDVFEPIFAKRNCHTTYSFMGNRDQGRIQDLRKGEADHGERAEREPITGVWGRSPQRGPGTEPLVGSGSEAPLKLKAFWLLNVPQSCKMHPVFLCLFAKCSFRNSKGFTPSEGVK